eukprot:CAMPEP_0172642046 /NCGR_PEP_ID=MMETSP1068-20121228/230406_1 /TAXON_ID=35684 /ORGANISM="Pseudopedinella elastica, Strain CCMP716" /LENGTH=273 /DNA_ID=CAMNT_0013455779 /DNA_START=45 /DNA_END=863 /DNA_ORIENTATION=+
MAAGALASGAWSLDFTNSSMAGDWRAVDDRIMGGSSRSRVAYSDGDGVTNFQGELVVEGGGFASARYDKELVLPSDTKALELEARGDGRLGYKVTLTTSVIPGGVSYQALLPILDSAEFTTVRLPLSSFKPSQQGRPVPGAPALEASNVRLLGLMLSRYEIGGEGVKESIQPVASGCNYGAFRPSSTPLSFSCRSIEPSSTALSLRARGSPGRKMGGAPSATGRPQNACAAEDRRSPGSSLGSRSPTSCARVWIPDAPHLNAGGRGGGTGHWG